MKRLTKQQFIEKANKVHNFKYNYSKVNYKNNTTKVTIICKKHGEFSQIPSNHLIGMGCYICKGGVQLVTHEFIEKAKQVHGNKYNYSQTKYKNNKTKVIIICNKHGKFLQAPCDHLQGNRCPKCSRRISRNENKWLNDLEKKKNIKIERNLTIYIDNKRFHPDGFDHKTNTIYEYNGYFWHGHPDYYHPNDINPRTKTTFGELYRKTLKREELIKSAGYNLIVKWG